MTQAVNSDREDPEPAARYGEARPPGAPNIGARLAHPHLALRTRHAHRRQSPAIARWLAISMLGAGTIAPAAAVETTLSAGASVTASNEHWTPVAFVDIAGERRRAGHLAWQPAATLGWIDARSVRTDLDDSVVIAAAGARLVDWWRNAFFSFQLGYADGRTSAISTHGQFISTLGWEGRRISVMVRHISNGGLFGGGRNLGETMVLAGWRF